MADRTEKQNDVIISILARGLIGIDNIYDIVCQGKRNPEGYIKVYNALDGTKTVTALAKIGGVTKGPMSQVLRQWEEAGIIYNQAEEGRPVYCGLLKLSVCQFKKLKVKR